MDYSYINIIHYLINLKVLYIKDYDLYYIEKLYNLEVLIVNYIDDFEDNVYRILDLPNIKEIYVDEINVCPIGFCNIIKKNY